MNIFEKLNKLSDGKRKEPSYIYLDEKDNQIKEIPLSKLDSAGSALINRKMKRSSPAQEIHKAMFGYID